MPPPMPAGSRARRDEDKLERRQQILDAAERLFRERLDGLPSMEELARAAGVAKGTLYLYFRSKEEVLVGLHERNLMGFFDRLDERLATKRRFTLEEMLALTREGFLADPARLALASLVPGLTERDLPAETALAFKARLGERLLAAGAALERALGLAPGHGVRLLDVSYALIVGMWQVKGCMGQERYRPLLEPRIAKAFLSDYPKETLEALRLLWTAAMKRRSR